MSIRSINPKFISQLLGESLDHIPAFPSISKLPGQHTKFINKNLGKIESPFASNVNYLTCTNCKKKAKYDVGLITINAQKYKEDARDIKDYIQTTGYFRCKHCNSAGAWEFPSEFQTMIITALMLLNTSVDDNRFSLGENKLYDGSSHHYATDAEEHLLRKIDESSEDAFIWNRLGNLYFKGNRADLAAVAFERSLELDPMQTESLYSLGSILLKVGKKEEAILYLYKTLLSASHYKQIDAQQLRDLLTDVLHDLLILYLDSDGVISLIPPKELTNEFVNEETGTIPPSVESLDLEISTDDFESLYPLAEIYMGTRREELL